MSAESGMPPFAGLFRASLVGEGDDGAAAVRTAAFGRVMAPVWRRFGALHKAAYLASGGQIGSSLLTIPMLLLSTRGRRSGLVRTIGRPRVVLTAA